MFKGSLVALITPFRNGGVDEKAFQDFVEWQISQGTHGLLPCGTTGESPTLSHAEHERVTEICVEVTNGRVPVLAGSGSNSTAEAISLTRHAKKCGADAALVVTPYYNKPTQEGLYQHFKALNDAVDGIHHVVHVGKGTGVIAAAFVNWAGRPAQCAANQARKEFVGPFPFAIDRKEAQRTGGEAIFPLSRQHQLFGRQL
jgi:hypothetical protein